MLSFNQTHRKCAVAAILTTLVITGISWTGTIVHSVGLNYDIYATDTVPSQKDKKQEINSLDDRIRALEKAQADLKYELNNKDWDKIEKEMENALARINTKEIEEQMEKAMKDLNNNFEKLDMEQFERKLDLSKLEQQLNELKIELSDKFNKKDWEKEMKAALDAMRQATREINKVNEQELKENLENIKEEMKFNKENLARDLEETRREMHANKGVIKESLDKAKAGIDESRQELMGYKTMIEQMEKEGLLKDPKNYLIEFDNGILKINGVKQPATVTDRYKKYFRHKKTMLINKNDQFGIEADN